MNRDELKEQIDELMKEYDDEIIDGDTYMREMRDLLHSSRPENDDE